MILFIIYFIKYDIPNCKKLTHDDISDKEAEGDCYESGESLKQGNMFLKFIINNKITITKFTSSEGIFIQNIAVQKVSYKTIPVLHKYIDA